MPYLVMKTIILSRPKKYSLFLYNDFYIDHRREIIILYEFCLFTYSFHNMNTSVYNRVIFFKYKSELLYIIIVFF